MRTRAPEKAILALVGFLALPAIVPRALWADETPPPPPPPPGWKDTAEFSYVVTSGNSQSSTLGFKDKLWRKWDHSAFEFNAGGIHAVSTNKNLFAVGSSPSDFEVVDGESQTTAENYYVNGRYDRNITERFFWFLGAGWDRNRPAGVDNRTVAAGGVGNIWIKTDKTKFRTDYSFTYTDEKDLVEDPTFKSTFSGFRLSSDFNIKVTPNSSYENVTILDENLDDTQDYRGNMINSYTATVSSRLALKVSLQWLYDHKPALKTLDLFDVPGGTNIGTVTISLDTLDTLFTTSLVVNF